MVSLDNLISIALLVVSIISVASAIYFAKKSLALNIEKLIDFKILKIFTTRDSMIKYVVDMYDSATNETDLIWGQSVSGRNYTGGMEKIIDAATHKVHFKLIFNESTRDTNEIAKVFHSVNTAQVKYRNDVTIRLQGLNCKEVVIAISDNSSYYGIAILSEPIVEHFYLWFMDRFEEATSETSC